MVDCQWCCERFFPGDSDSEDPYAFCSIGCQDSEEEACREAFIGDEDY